MKIIGLTSTTGPGSGKSTVGDILEVIYTFQGYKVKRLAFADIIKAQHKALFGSVDKDKKYSIVGGVKSSFMTGREQLIKLGESAREICPDIWVLGMDARIRALKKTDIVIIDDVRKLAEANLIWMKFGFVFDIQSLEYTQSNGDTELVNSDVSVVINPKECKSKLIREVRKQIYNKIEGLS